MSDEGTAANGRDSAAEGQDTAANDRGTTPTDSGASYAAAGVDIDAGERAVELFAPHAKRATRPEAVSYTHLTLPTICSV